MTSTRAHIILGQIADYMQDRKVKYGVMSNYNETIFLRQVTTLTSAYLEYSPIIRHDDMYTPAPRSVTLRQCFFHVALLSLQPGARFTKLPTGEQWTMSVQASTPT